MFTFTVLAISNYENRGVRCCPSSLTRLGLLPLLILQPLYSGLVIWCIHKPGKPNHDALEKYQPETHHNGFHPITQSSP